MKLRQGGVKLKAKKCEFNASWLSMFGFIVDQGGSRPEPEKTEAITRIRVSTCIKDVRSFLGLAGLPPLCEKVLSDRRPVERAFEEGRPIRLDAEASACVLLIKRGAYFETCPMTPKLF